MKRKYAAQIAIITIMIVLTMCCVFHLDFAAAGGNEEPAKAGADLDVTKDVVYVTRGETQVKGNLYRPKKEGLLPGLVLAHGGGFVAGDKDHYNIPETSEIFAARGYVVFSVNYRHLQQGGLFPANAQDVKCAVQWLRANAEKYGVDTSRIAIMGNSAGGYMAQFAAVTQHNDEFNASCGIEALDNVKPEVNLVITWYGVHDLAAMKGNLVGTMEKLYFGGVKDKAKFKKWVSPITYADQSPPALMVHGDADQLVPISQSRTMCAAIKAAGGDCTLIEFPGDAHGFIDEKFGTPDSMKAIQVTLDWLDKRMAELKKEQGKKN